MRYRPRDHALSWAACVLLAVIVSLTPLHGDDQSIGDGTGILFLQLHIDRNGVSLVDSEIVPGTLKGRRTEVQDESPGFHYEAKSTSGVTLATGELSNPLIRRIEYEDPANPGLLKSKVIELDEADFVLRLGFRKDIASIDFYRIEQNDTKAGVISTRKHLGTVTFGLESGGGE